MFSKSFFFFNFTSKHVGRGVQEAFGGIQIMLSHRQTLLLNNFKMLGNKNFITSIKMQEN